MDLKRIAPFVLAASLAVGAMGGIAHAEDRDRDQGGRDAVALGGTNVIFLQAIAPAEQQATGRAIVPTSSRRAGSHRSSSGSRGRRASRP